MPCPVASRNVCSKAMPDGDVENDCICCSERKMIKKLLRESVKKGVKYHGFSDWVNRKHGTLHIWRNRRDGVLGNSLPCVLCRKAIDKHKLKWVAYLDEKWVKSTDIDVPKSVPTRKQTALLGFEGNPE